MTSERGALVVNEPLARYGEPILMRPRLGQGSFRVVVTEAYRRKCAITGESTLLALEAAHIVPYAEEGAHDVRNGLLLRADFHRLFDAGLVSVTPDMTIRVSPRIRDTPASPSSRATYFSSSSRMIPCTGQIVGGEKTAGNHQNVGLKASRAYR